MPTLAETIHWFLIRKVTGTKLWRKFSWDLDLAIIKFLTLYFRACGIAADGTRVDFSPKSNLKTEHLDDGNACEMGEELRPTFSDEKTPVEVESDNITVPLLSRS